MQSLNALQLGRAGSNDGMEATIKNYELAWRMQMEAPELTDLTGETEATKKIYGIGEKATDSFGKQCLLARRMVERGVRYASVNYSDESNNPRWDQHSNMPKHADHARNTDKPVAGLLRDLKARAFSRTPSCGGAENSAELPFRKTRTDGITIPAGLPFFLPVVA